jgi:hypothetical protein
MGRAVTQHDLLPPAANQLREQAAKPLRHLTEIIIIDPVRRYLQRGCSLGRPHRRPGQRSLMGRVEPRPPVKRTELARSSEQRSAPRRSLHLSTLS